MKLRSTAIAAGGFLIAISGLIGITRAHQSFTDISVEVNYWKQLNTNCRGSIDPIIALRACNQRKIQTKKLKSLGLCLGKYNLSRFKNWNADTLVREKWIPCIYKNLTE